MGIYFSFVISTNYFKKFQILIKFYNDFCQLNSPILLKFTNSVQLINLDIETNPEKGKKENKGNFIRETLR